MYVHPLGRPLPPNRADVEVFTLRQRWEFHSLMVGRVFFVGREALLLQASSSTSLWLIQPPKISAKYPKNFDISKA